MILKTGKNLPFYMLVLTLVGGCSRNQKSTPYQDSAFWQEYHEAYPVGSTVPENDVRDIAVDGQSNIWIASAAGVYQKNNHAPVWRQVPAGETAGPAYAVHVAANHDIWVGNWKGLYRYQNQKLEKVTGPEGPVSLICSTPNTVFALGPDGLWASKGTGFVKIEAALPGSVRDITASPDGGLWIATDVGLYYWSEKESRHFYKTNDIISGYTKGVAFDHQGKLWVGGLGGVTIRNSEGKEKVLLPKDGVPSVFVTRIRRAPDSTMWVGSQTGVVRYRPDGSHSLRFSRRWLLDDHVNAIAFDTDGTAWIATPNGVSAIRKKKFTLAQKNDYFMDVLMKRHIRAPWIAGQAHLVIPGDTTSWKPEDDDNDGEYTGNYLAMESFRYAATKSPEARENAKKAFGFLKFLQEVTDTDGFFARTVVPANWTGLHDENRTYTPIELAEERVKEPRFKPVEMRWRKSKDGKWLWKGDTSSDEMCGHMFGYYFYYTLVADEAEKKVIAAHIGRIVDHLMKHNYNMTDIDGKHTRWSVWSPDDLNRNPEWVPDRNQNSMELLTFLKLAYHTTGNQKYEKEYRRLIEKEHYLQNMSEVTMQNPAWFIYFDVVLQAYLYPILMKCEQDPELLKFYSNHLDKWFDKRRADHNPLINFIYNYSQNKKEETAHSVDFLIDTPLDLVDWPIDHRKREDIKIVRAPSLEEEQLGELQPASIRMTVRWDKNPWTLAGGNPQVEREPVFWLLPYWMGKYLKLIE
ncbi:hypothetical protein DYBT9275_00179 [Dyadobacter sp. CECT 9275]|uniref:Two component regulator propeller n=1 Tax=Dyadobacter helix TaxID=2822344 RepID=A0A916JB33_9BACT|nr:regulator [Dyadobacter sp. CECT 9275]CAG4988884.1 hypothetical protein DYBT9275_00179 [Dyadobacter sp. CECT 9275]